MSPAERLKEVYPLPEIEFRRIDNEITQAIFQKADECRIYLLANPRALEEIVELANGFEGSAISAIRQTNHVQVVRKMFGIMNEKYLAEITVLLIIASLQDTWANMLKTLQEKNKQSKV